MRSETHSGSARNTCGSSRLVVPGYQTSGPEKTYAASRRWRKQGFAAAMRYLKKQNDDNIDGLPIIGPEPPISVLVPVIEEALG